MHIYCRGQCQKARKWFQVYVRPYHRATITCLEDHVKPVLLQNPDKIIFHTGANDLPSEMGTEI